MIAIYFKGDREEYIRTLRLLIDMVGRQDPQMMLDAEESYYLSNLIQCMLPDQIPIEEKKLSHFAAENDHSTPKESAR